MGRTLMIRQLTPCLLLLPLLAHVLFTEWWVNADATGTLDPLSLSNTTVGQSLTTTIASLEYDPFANICLVQTQLTPAQAGVIYALQISPHHSYSAQTEIHVIQVRGWASDLWWLNPNLTVINTIPITIASPDPSNNFVYYFNSSQLLEVQPNDLLGYCFGPRPFFLKDTSATTDSYTWTPTSLSIGTITSSSNITAVYDYSLNLQFLQWNANLTDLNMTLFDGFYSTHPPPVIPPMIGDDPFYLPTTPLGDFIPSDASLTSDTPNQCIVPNIPATDPTLVYAFEGSSLSYNPYGPFILKLAHLRILNPSTVIPDVSITTVVKLIQSVDVTIATTYGDDTPFYYQLPADQVFSLQPGDFIGYCINDTIAQWYFNYGYPNDGHSAFTFYLDYASQPEVSLSSQVYDFNAVGWTNHTRDQLNSDELGVFLDRRIELNSFTRATYLEGAGPFTDMTAPILTPAKTLLDPSTLSETTIGTLVSSTLYDKNDDWCTVIKPTIGPGVVYGLRSSLVPPLAQDTTITILYGYEEYDPVFTITNQVSIVIPASTTSTQFEFYLTYEQLFSTVSYTSVDSVIGWCTPASQPGVFAYVAGFSDPTIYQWSRVSYQSGISATYKDHRRYDFELLQWADISFNDLNETETRQFLTQMAIHSNTLRPNTYHGPALIDPTNNYDYDYLYGYQYTSYDGSWITPSMDSQLSSPTCVLFDYSSTTYGNLNPSVLYWVSASQIASANHTVNLTLIIARDDSVYQDKSLFIITQVRHVPIPPSDSPTPLIYYFPPDQLIQVNTGDYLGYCDHGDDVLSYYPTYSSSYGYEWTGDAVTVDSLISSPSSSYQRVDLQVHGWKDLKIEQLNFTAVDQFLTEARQAAGSARGVTTPTNPTSSSGGLSSSGRTALIVCMVLFGVGLITCLIIARSMRRRSPAPAPISHPPNQHIPSVAANGPIQPKPASASSSVSPSPIRVQAASSPPAPLRNPYQPQPIIYRGNQEGIRINLPPSAPPNPYVYPSPTASLPPPSVSPSAAVSSSSSIELLPLSRPPVSLSSIENDIPNQPPPQYDPTIDEVEVEGQANVNIHLDSPPPSQPLVPEVCQPHEPFSPIQPVLMYPPTNISQISSPSSPLVYSATRQPSYPSMALSASSSLTPIPGGVTPTTVTSVDEKRFCEQCGRPKTSKMAIFCSGCGTKY